MFCLLHGCNTRQCDGREWVLRAVEVYDKVMETNFKHGIHRMIVLVQYAIEGVEADGQAWNS